VHSRSSNTLRASPQCISTPRALHRPCVCVSSTKLKRDPIRGTVRCEFESELSEAKGKGRNEYPIASGMDKVVESVWRTRPSRRDLSRFRALNYMCVEWNSVHPRSAGESNFARARAFTCARTFRFSHRLVSSFFFPSRSLFLPFSLFIRIVNKYTCCIDARTRG